MPTYDELQQKLRRAEEIDDHSGAKEARHQLLELSESSPPYDNSEWEGMME